VLFFLGAGFIFSPLMTRGESRANNANHVFSISVHHRQQPPIFG